mmetsp:Transcript_32400/g.69373  ORF Transcript_32400/g.69373 Transcript_32400/m.69373 type:complete len:237 (-) Transcript_32400:144-854(-)
MVALIQEIVYIYPQLSSPGVLTANASNRVCNSLALLQCVASHPETRPLFLKAQIPYFLYPFLCASYEDRPFEYLRLTSLGVIGALVKVDDSEVIEFLLKTQILPLCLTIMGTGSELSKTVACFIVQKLLLDNAGLQYICHTAEKFALVADTLNTMVSGLEREPSSRLMKHVIRCYLRLSEDERAKEQLQQNFPSSLRVDMQLTTLSPNLHQSLKDDPTTTRWLQQLIANMQTHGQR